MKTLQVFHEVARRRSFSEAAARQGVTQSAVSQRVSQLEQQLGVTLIDRSVRPFELTAAGRIYDEGLSQILADLDRLERRVVKVGSAEASGKRVLQVAAIYSAGIDLLSRAAEAWQTEEPDACQVVVRYDKPDEVHRQVLSGQADVGLLSYGETLDRVSLWPLWNEQMVVICPPGHPLSREVAVRPKHLQAFDMVGFDLALPVGRAVDSYLRSNGAAVEMDDRFDNLDTLKAAVAATDRPAIVPWRTAARELASRALVAVELRPTLLRPIGAITKPDRAARKMSNGSTPGQPLDTARRFVSFLVRLATKDPLGVLPADAAEQPGDSSSPLTPAGAST